MFDIFFNKLKLSIKEEFKEKHPTHQELDAFLRFYLDFKNVGCCEELNYKYNKEFDILPLDISTYISFLGLYNKIGYVTTNNQSIFSVNGCLYEFKCDDNKYYYKLHSINV